MITYFKNSMYTADENVVEIACLSTDTKPTSTSGTNFDGLVEE